MARKDCCTIAAMWMPLMGKPDIDRPDGCCCWCGRPATDRHHIVKRSAGKLVRSGREVPKPTVRLCGMGNASGCHGKAHAGRLHFRRAGDGGAEHWEGIETSEPMKYQEALELEGWRRL